MQNIPKPESASTKLVLTPSKSKQIDTSMLKDKTLKLLSLSTVLSSIPVPVPVANKTDNSNKKQKTEENPVHQPFVFNTKFGSPSFNISALEQSKAKKPEPIVFNECTLATEEIRRKNPDMLAADEYVIYVKKFHYVKDSADIQICDKKLIKLFDLDNKVLGSLHFRKLDNRDAACYKTNLNNYWVDIIKAIDGFNTEDRYFKLAVLCYKETVTKLL